MPGVTGAGSLIRVVRRDEMTPSLPSDFVLTATDNTALASGFTRLAQNVDLCAVESLLPLLPADSGCYLWLLCHECRQYKVYLGRAGSIRKRVKDYGLDFQLHSPNDFKLRLFYSFMTEWWPGSTLDLYFAAHPAAHLRDRERDLIRQFRPLINNLPAPSDDERTIVQDAFRAYYRSVLGRLLGPPIKTLERTGLSL